MQAKHFSYTLNFIGPKITLTFEGQVAAVDETFENLSSAGKGFGIPHDQFMAQFVDEDRKFKYSLEIRNLKEEAKDENYDPEFLTVKILKNFYWFVISQKKKTTTTTK